MISLDNNIQQHLTTQNAVPTLQFSNKIVCVYAWGKLINLSQTRLENYKPFESLLSRQLSKKLVALFLPPLSKPPFFFFSSERSVKCKSIRRKRVKKRGGKKRDKKEEKKGKNRNSILEKLNLFSGTHLIYRTKVRRWAANDLDYHDNRSRLWIVVSIDYRAIHEHCVRCT